MVTQPYQERLKKCSQLMKETTVDILLLTKPANMFYLTGDGLCRQAKGRATGSVRPISLHRTLGGTGRGYGARQLRGA
jgi:hypothetical protein